MSFFLLLNEFPNLHVYWVILNNKTGNVGICLKIYPKQSISLNICVYIKIYHSSISNIREKLIARIFISICGKIVDHVQDIVDNGNKTLSTVQSFGHVYKSSVPDFTEWELGGLVDDHEELCVWAADFSHLIVSGSYPVGINCFKFQQQIQF